MSHSRVFQLEKGIKKSEYDEQGVSLLTENYLEKDNFPDPNWVDWWQESKDRPEEDFKWLVECLPQGCFDVDMENLSLTLKKLPKDYIRGYFEKIKEESNKLNLIDYLHNNCSTWQLNKLIRNGNNDFMIFQDDFGYPDYLHEWLMELAKSGNIGDTWYLGGVLDYHF